MQCSTKPIIFYFKLLILCTVCQLWPSGDCFIFNFYCHWSSIVLRNRSGVASFLHSKEGVTQGDPLAMIAYGVGILPLIDNLKQEKPDINQPWYNDDARSLVTFTIIGNSFNLLTRQGEVRNIIPDRPKAY